MSKTRNKGIIAYGTEDDRAKLAALAKLRGRSGSEEVINLIRQSYEGVFGDVDAKSIIKDI